jgi:hypothetical protein
VLLRERLDLHPAFLFVEGWLAWFVGNADLSGIDRTAGAIGLIIWCVETKGHSTRNTQTGSLTPLWPMWVHHVLQAGLCVLLQL